MRAPKTQKRQVTIRLTLGTLALLDAARLKVLADGRPRRQASLSAIVEAAIVQAWRRR